METRKIAQIISVSIIAGFLVGFPVIDNPAAEATPLFVYYDGNCDLTNGFGSSGDPYQISNADQLWEITDCDITNSAQAYFEIVSTIDVSTAILAPTQSPIGLDNANNSNPFRGVLEGNNHAITNIGMSSSGSIVGLFALLQDATVRNLSLYGSVSTTAGPAAGGLAANSAGDLLIQSVSNHVNVSGYWRVGGLIGEAGTMLSLGNTTIESSKNFGTVTAPLIYVGGLVGSSGNLLSISRSINEGQITGPTANAGGLVGIVYKGLTIDRSINEGPIQASGDYIGGLIGYLWSVSITEITNSYNSATVSGTSRVGGIIGESGADRMVGGALRIVNSYNSGAVAGQSFVDGLIGQKNAGDLYNTLTLVTSQWTSSSTLGELQVASTFVGFDFSIIWGFGPCSMNKGLPLLRDFAGVESFSSTACEPAQIAPQEQPIVTTTPAVAPKIPVFNQFLIARPGESLLAQGKNFELIEFLTIDGEKLEISQITTVSVQIQIPEIAAGIYDLVAQTRNGRVTYQGQLRIVEREVLLEDFQLPNVNPNSSWLNRNLLENLASKKGKARLAKCIAYQKSLGITARKKALSRATRACDEFASRGIRVKVFAYSKAPSFSDRITLKFEQ